MACSKAHTHDKHLPRVQKVIELRMKGVSWIRCAEEVGWGTSKTGTSLLQWIKVQYPEVIQSMSLETYKKVFPRSDPKRDGVLDVINLEKAGNKNC